MLHARLRAAAGRGGIPTDGLVAHYTMDNISGSTLIDEMGNYDGTISGATQTTGVIGQALSFDGNDSVDFGEAANIPKGADGDKIFISLWINTTAGTGTRTILAHENGSSGWILRLESGVPWLRIYGDAVQSQGGSIASGSWVNLMIEWEIGSYVDIYTNNALQISEPVVSTGGASTGAKFLMGKGVDIDNYYNGKIDQVRIYNRTLIDQERLSLYNEGA